MSLQLSVISANYLLADERQEILDLCTEAYEEDFTPILELFPDAIHILARLEDKLLTLPAINGRGFFVHPGGLLAPIAERE